MLGIYRNPLFWVGVGGVALGLFLGSKSAKQLAAKGVAAGMIARDNMKAGWDSVKEEADDIYENAKEEIAEKNAKEGIKLV